MRSLGMQLVFYDQNLNAYFSLEEWTPETRPDNPHAFAHYTIVWLREGRLAAETDFYPFIAEKDHVFFITPGQRMRFGTEFPERATVLSFNKPFYCVELHDAEVSCNGLLFNGAAPSPMIHLDAPDVRSFTLLLEVVRDEMGTADTIQLEMLQLLLKRWIIKSARIARDQLTVHNQGNDQEIDVLRAYSALVEKHFREWHKVGQYAEKMLRSPKTLSNLFRKYGSPSPSEIITERIVLEAKRELIYTKNSVKQIAYGLGFDDPAHFSRYFAKAVGNSPVRFRENGLVNS
ncbi:MAG: helix-turn-helix domain-containing protein [Bacteroidota bacterium]